MFGPYFANTIFNHFDRSICIASGAKLSFDSVIFKKTANNLCSDFMVHLRKRDPAGFAKSRNLANRIKGNEEKKETEKSAKLLDYFSSGFSFVFGDVNGFSSGSETDSAYTPLNSIAFKLFLISRFCSAMMSNINDCDETYNYWEPLHFISYGCGFQTWEYSPHFALRSYAFLWLYGWIVPLANYFAPSRLVMFFVVRLTLAFLCSFFELLFYRAVVKIYGNSVARLVLLFLAFSPGMFAASVAFLPSSFAMYMCLIAFSSVLLFQNFLAISSIALSVLVAWPFCAIIGIPVALDVIFIQKKFKVFIFYSIISFFLIMSYMCYIDSQYYNKFVVATFNIVNYNIFSSHGPDLYGTEPLSYYFKNAFLNMTVAFPLSLVLPVVLLAKSWSKNMRDIFYYSRKWLPLLALYLWYFVFFMQPHKEERFLYPIYPLIALAAACTLALFSSFFSKTSRLRYIASTVTFLALSTHITLGVSRIGAQFVGFHAHMDVYGDFNVWYEQNHLINSHGVENKEDPTVENSILCVGREWYRFPSSFFLPDNVRLHFIQSEFKGELLCL